MRLQTYPFLGGFVGVLALGLVAGIIAVSTAENPGPTGPASSAEASPIDLQKILASRRFRCEKLARAMAALEAEWREYFGGMARQAIAVQESAEKEQGEKNRFLADPQIHMLIRKRLEEERRREFLTEIADASDRQIKTFESILPLSTAQEDVFRVELNRHNLQFETWRRRMPVFSKREIVEGFKSLSDDFTGVINRVLTADQLDFMQKSSGGRVPYKDLIDQAQEAEDYELRENGPESPMQQRQESEAGS